MSWEAPGEPGRRWTAVVGAIAIVVAVAAAAAMVRPRSEASDLAVDRTGGDAVGTDLDGSVFDDGLVRAPLDPAETHSDGAPVPDAPELAIVIADFTSRLQLIDLATGSRRNVPVFAGGTRQRPDALQVIGDSIIFDAAGRVLRLIEGDEGSPQQLARNHRSIPTADTGSVWIYDQLTADTAGVASRITFDGTVEDRIGLPALAQPVAGTADSLIVRTPGTISRIDTDGGHRQIARGQALASDGTHIARLDCLADLSCGIVIGTVDEPDQVRITLRSNDLLGGLYDAPQGRFSPDGRWFALPVHRERSTGRPAQSSVVVIDVAVGAETARLPGSALTAPATPFAWSPDSRWLVVSTGTGLRVWSVASGRAQELALRLPPTYAVTVR